jgi:hypothetical protein
VGRQVVKSCLSGATVMRERIRSFSILVLFSSVVPPGVIESYLVWGA